MTNSNSHSRYRKPQWKCVDSKTSGKRILYSRFVLSPLMKGEAETLGVALRRTLLGEIEGTCITRAKFANIPHEYSSIFGIEEPVHEILMNLKEIILKGPVYGIQGASVCARGPGCVTARNILLPSTMEIVDRSQYIANLTEPIDLRIELQIERGCGYRGRNPNLKNEKDRSYPIDAVFMPVRSANYSIHSYGNENQEILFLEIWTNGSLTPKDALEEASHKALNLFLPFLNAKEEDLLFDPKQTQNEYHGGFPFDTSLFFSFREKSVDLRNPNTKLAKRCIFLDQLGFTRRLYTSLKKYSIHTLSDFLNLGEADLERMRIDFGLDDRKTMLDFIMEYSRFDELKFDEPN